MRAISLFSGLHGLDLGLSLAGIEVAWANDNDAWASRSAAWNTMPPSVHCPALSDADFWALDLPRVSKALGPFDLLVGGPPCQSFSTAGRRREDDPRGLLLFGFVDAAVQLATPFVLLENVRGLLSARTPTGLLVLAEAVRRLERAGYAVSFDLYDAANYGVPQRRERLLLFASRTGRVPRVPPTHYDDPSLGLPPHETVRKALTPRPAECTHVPFRAAHANAMSRVPEGGNWRDLPAAVAKRAMKGAYLSGGGKTGYFRRLAWDSPAPTLTTNPAMPATMLGHPDEPRPLSVEEYLRLQTFPDDWTVCGPVEEQYRQIGNAVPVRLAQRVGEHLLAFAAGAAPCDGSLPPLSRYGGTSDFAWRKANLLPTA